MKNKKAELRIHHLFIAVMVFSLFTVVLYSGTKDMFGENGFNMSESDYINSSNDGNAKIKGSCRFNISTILRWNDPRQGRIGDYFTDSFKTKRSSKLIYGDVNGCY